MDSIKLKKIKLKPIKNASMPNIFEQFMKKSNEKRMNNPQSMPKMKTPKNKIFTDNNNNNTNPQSLPFLKPLKNKNFNDNRNNNNTNLQSFAFLKPFKNKNFNDNRNNNNTNPQSMPKIKTPKNKIFTDNKNNNNTNPQSMPKKKTLKNKNFNDNKNNNNDRFFKHNNYNDNINFSEIIKNKYTIEDYYYYKKYNLQYFTNEDINYFTNIRNIIYPDYKKMKYILIIEKIKDNFLKKHLSRVCIEQTLFYQYERLDLKFIEAVDLIILKEIQYEQNNDIKIKLEKHLKEEKDMEIISDRILGNIDNNVKLNNVVSLKDIDK